MKYLFFLHLVPGFVLLRLNESVDHLAFAAYLVEYAGKSPVSRILFLEGQSAEFFCARKFLEVYLAGLDGDVALARDLLSNLVALHEALQHGFTAFLRFLIVKISLAPLRKIKLRLQV